MLGTKTKMDNPWFATPSWSSVANQALALAKKIGAEALSTMYPYDFEYYMCSLALCTNAGTPIDYLAFPVMPDSISVTVPNRNNIKKSMSGVTLLSNPNFTPKEISISGSFGRGFKILVDGVDTSKANDLSIKSGKYSLYSIQGDKSPLSMKVNSFNMSVKTGYGIIKILEAIIDKSVGLDNEGRPLKLYFYNMALGESYLVAVSPGGLQIHQDIGKNMIWNYSLTMTALFPGDIPDYSNIVDEFVVSAVSGGVGVVAKAVGEFLKPYASMATTYGLTGF